VPLWLIPFLYTAASIAGSFILPRLEARYFAYDLDLSVASTQAYLSAVASGMMAVTGIVFSIAFVMVQFNPIVTHLGSLSGLRVIACCSIRWAYSSPPFPTVWERSPGLTAREEASCRCSPACWWPQC
jgi:Predicted membrane protein (DUF2254)